MTSHDIQQIGYFSAVKNLGLHVSFELLRLQFLCNAIGLEVILKLNRNLSI